MTSILERETLVLYPYINTTTQRLAHVALEQNLNVHVLTSQSVPDTLTSGTNFLYSGPIVADKVYKDLSLGLLDPPPELLSLLHPDFVGRDVRAITLQEAWEIRRPMFFKPYDTKGFKAKPYADGSYLPGPDALEPETVILCSELITPLSEFRLFLLDGNIVASSHYATKNHLDVVPTLGHPEEHALWEFVDKLLPELLPLVPSSVVLDVGLISLPYDQTPRWAVIEANAAWGSGLYAASPAHVLECVKRAGGTRERVRTNDAKFLRHSKH